MSVCLGTIIIYHIFIRMSMPFLFFFGFNQPANCAYDKKDCQAGPENHVEHMYYLRFIVLIIAHCKSFVKYYF